jgi:hypothetical protein
MRTLAEVVHSFLSEYEAMSSEAVIAAVLNEPENLDRNIKRADVLRVLLSQHFVSCT